MTMKQREVSTREGYARWADEYDDYPNPMTAMVDHVLAHATVDLAGLDLLELGCGTARNVERLGATFASYLGIDDCPEMLEVGRARRADPPRVELERRDLRADWRLPPGSRDVVLISLVLEHFEDLAPLFRAAHEVVRPGGLLWAIELHPALHRQGIGAHIATAEETLVLPSTAHDSEQLAAVLLAGGWEPETTTDWYATAALEERSPKLARHRGRPVVLELRARRRET
ncbi:MAG TPA: class I SAM-dependent methyltransferase [Kofleriaceae bacterium]|nr:class I SAM-dependent methyltransferase [Kofleriaceae bacterium]